MQSKICGVKDSETLNFLINYKYPPELIGFICNYQKSKRCIQIRDVQGVDDNPFDFETVKKNIEDKLNPEFEGRFKIMLVPNITNICYGRGVGYKIEEIELSKKIQEISATKIRAKMREEGKLK